MDLSYIINHLGEDRAQYFGAVSPPIMQTSNFAYDSVAAMRHALTHEIDVPFYTRGHNPTVAILRKKLAALEGAEEALVFSSGSAAVSAAVLSQVQAGDHIVSVAKPYSWTYKLLTQFLPRFGVTHTLVDGRNARNYEAAITDNTRLFILESPNSITFELQDIAAVSALARARGISTLIDNSYATPVYQQPIAMGIDLVVHSATKYLNGHSDALAGVICGSRQRCEEIFRSEYMTLGAAISPHDAWLLLRGLRTLPLRMERVSASTPKVVAYLEAHPKVKKVHYPFSPSSPQLSLAQQQMKAPAGQFSIEIDAPDIAAVDAFCDRLQYFLLACSWGGHESLIFPTSALYDSANYRETTMPYNLIRFYIGLEDPDVLIRDLEQGFDVI